MGTLAYFKGTNLTFLFCLFDFLFLARGEGSPISTQGNKNMD